MDEKLQAIKDKLSIFPDGCFYNDMSGSMEIIPTGRNLNHMVDGINTLIEYVAQKEANNGK